MECYNLDSLEQKCQLLCHFDVIKSRQFIFLTLYLLDLGFAKFDMSKGLSLKNYSDITISIRDFVAKDW